jgi:PTS system mannose-specific IID component
VKPGGWGILARSFLVQASWSYRWMQNLGFASMTLPALRRLRQAGGGELSPQEALAQADFFNTHPYLGAAVAGLSLRLREEAADGESFLEAQAQAKEAFMGPLGALGDDFFWATLRPLSGCLGVLLAMTGRPWAGILLFLALYNLIHLRVRWVVLRHGLEGEAALVDYLVRADYHARSRFTRHVSALLFAAIPLFWASWDLNPWRRPVWIMTLAAIAYVAGAAAVLRRLDPRQTVLLTLLGALLIIGWQRVMP